MALVGAGPGDVELVTLRAEGLLGVAAIVVTDAAVAPLAWALAPQAEVVVVPDDRPAAAALLTAATGGRGTVVRVYAGDPWLHPAHGIELSALRHAGITTEAVAGVAIEVAVPALAGIPVHVRQLAVVCTIGPVEAMPAAADPARTLLVRSGDAAAAARALAPTGASALPAAVVPVPDGGGPAGRPDAAANAATVAAAGGAARGREAARLGGGDVAGRASRAGSGDVGGWGAPRGRGGVGAAAAWDPGAKGDAERAEGPGSSGRTGPGRFRGGSSDGARARVAGGASEASWPA
ncbi:MAG: SAM-dependent methyltransferase, partial [Acidimicrobiales bacterium]